MTDGALVVLLVGVIGVSALTLGLLWLVDHLGRRKVAGVARPEQLRTPPIAAKRAKADPSRRIWLLAGVAVLVVAALVAHAFWPKGSLNTPLVESEIEAWARDNGVQGSIAIDCPDSMPIKAGAEYHCILTKDGAESGLPVTVHVENNDGEITWQGG